MKQATIEYNDPLWAERREFSRAEAWVDLNLAAGEDGLVGLSVRGLGRRWLWSKDRVSRFLVWLVGQGRLALLPDDAKKGRLLVSRWPEGSARVLNLARQAKKDKKEEEDLKAREELLAAAGRVWEAYLAQRERLLKAAKRPIQPVKRSDARTKNLLTLLDTYGEDRLLQVVRGLQWSEYHRGVGRFSSNGPRLSPERVFLVNGKINNVEVLSDLAETKAAKAKAKAAEVETVASAYPDGHLFPDGTLWSKVLGKAVVAEDYSPHPDPGPEPWQPNGQPVGPHHTWDAATRRPVLKATA